jgi:signal transduction histidine kinase
VKPSRPRLAADASIWGPVTAITHACVYYQLDAGRCAPASESTPTGGRVLVADEAEERPPDLAIVDPMVPTRIHQVLPSVLEVSASSLGRGVTISIDCKIDLMARFAPARVERVLHDLVRGAARDGNQGGSIVVGARRCNDDSAVISVIDSGPRIAGNIRSHGPSSTCAASAASAG